MTQALRYILKEADTYSDGGFARINGAVGAGNCPMISRSSAELEGILRNYSPCFLGRNHKLFANHSMLAGFLSCHPLIGDALFG